MLKLTVLEEMPDKKNISLINSHLSLLAKLASMHHQLIKELLFPRSSDWMGMAYSAGVSVVVSSAGAVGAV